MATSSIFKTIYIRDRKMIGKFVSALEGSKQADTPRVEFTRPVERLEDPDRIRQMFGVKKDDGIQDPDDR